MKSTKMLCIAATLLLIMLVNNIEAGSLEDYAHKLLSIVDCKNKELNKTTPNCIDCLWYAYTKKVFIPEVLGAQKMCQKSIASITADFVEYTTSIGCHEANWTLCAFLYYLPKVILFASLVLFHGMLWLIWKNKTNITTSADPEGTNTEANPNEDTNAMEMTEIKGKTGKTDIEMNSETVDL